MDGDGLTENVARKRYCCVEVSRICVASECMAWRWAGHDGDWKRRPSGVLMPTPVGFCGRAELRAVIVKES